MKDNVKKCTECDGLMIHKFIPYTTEREGKTITIDDVYAYECPKCGNTFIEDSVKKVVDNQIKAEVLKVLATKDVEYLTVSYLKRIRIKKGLSQRELGNVLGVSEQRYGAIERNNNTPIISIALLLSNFLGVGIQEVYKLVTVPTSLYEKLLNTKIEGTLVDGYKFKYIKEIANLRDKVNSLKDEMQSLNAEKRSINYKLDTTDKLDKDLEKRVEEIDKIIEDIKGIKDGRKGLESKLKKLEKKHSIIIKQESVIDADDWDLVETNYKKELRNQ